MPDPVWNPEAVADYLITKGKTHLPVAEAGQLGVPRDSEHKLSICVTMGSLTIAPWTNQSLQIWTRFWVLFAHRLDRNEDQAERSIMNVVRAFLLDLYSDQSFGGLVSQIEVETAVSDEPEYNLIRRREFREYPILVRACQYDMY